MVTQKLEGKKEEEIMRFFCFLVFRLERNFVEQLLFLFASLISSFVVTIEQKSEACLLQRPETAVQLTLTLKATHPLRHPPSNLWPS